MRNKKRLGDAAEYSTNKAEQFAASQRAGNDENPRLNRRCTELPFKAPLQSALTLKGKMRTVIKCPKCGAEGNFYFEGTYIMCEACRHKDMDKGVFESLYDKWLVAKPLKGER